MVWSKRFIVIGLVAMTLLFGSTEETSCTDLSGPMSIMPYNIRGNPTELGDHAWFLRSSGISGILMQEQADIVCFQECWFPFLVSYAWEYEVVGSRYYESGGTPILYNPDRFRVIKSGGFDLPGSHWSIGKKVELGASRRCTWSHFVDVTNDEQTFVFNLHLDVCSDKNRLESLEILEREVDHIAGDNHVIVVGDFNIEADERDIAEFKKSLNLVDAYRVEHQTLEGITLNGFDRARPRRIDYVLVCRCLNVISAEVIECDNPPSDHNPLKVELEWK